MSAPTAQSLSPTSFQVFAPRGLSGGKRVTVFGAVEGERALLKGATLQGLAAAAGTPLSAFVESVQGGEVGLRVFTPEREKGESDSASVAALAALHAQGLLADFAEVRSGGQATSAQWCGGEWLLSQGSPSAEAVTLGEDARTLLASLGISPRSAHVASTARPNLLLEVEDLATLEGFVPQAERLATLGQLTATTGLVLYALGAPPAPALRRADVSLRTFGPLRGFLEDAASSNMCACLVAVLGERGLWPEDSFVLRAAQLQPGHPSLLTAQFSEPGQPVWVGGRAEPLGSWSI